MAVYQEKYTHAHTVLTTISLLAV